MTMKQGVPMSSYFNEYQQWTDTTVTGNLLSLVGSPTELSYLVLGLTSEAKEYFSAMYPSDRMKEAGDIFWYSARLCNHFNLKFDEVVRNAKAVYVTGPDAKEHSPLHMPAVFQAVGNISDMVKKIIRDGRKFESQSEERLFILLQLSRILGAIMTDLTCMDDVFCEQSVPDPDYFKKLGMALVEGNKMKLTSRLDRKTLGGSGDER